MHHVLVILLHRPFVADGHLYSTSRQISVDSFMKCASAASAIVQLLRAYHAAFSIRRAPYLISYATYVAATIHTRIAARRNNDSTAHANLATCLAVFRENQETNSAVRKASVIVEGLMKKLGVVVEQRVSADALKMDQASKSGTNAAGLRPRQSTSAAKPANSPSPSTPRRSTSGAAPNKIDLTDSGIAAGPAASSPASDMMDVDGIIQSFLQESEAAGRAAPPVATQSYTQPYSMQQWFSQNNPAPAFHAHLYSATSLPGQMPMTAGVVGPMPSQGPGGGEAVPVMTAPWQQNNGEHVGLEDPLFGFNGSALDDFSFLGW